MRAKSRLPGRTVSDTRPWYERDPQALEAVRRIASEHGSALALRIDDTQKLVILEGKLRFAPVSPGGTPDFVRVNVVLSRCHPVDEPFAYDADSRFPQSPTFHKFSGSDLLCLWLAPESEWSGDDEALRPYLDHAASFGRPILS